MKILCTIWKSNKYTSQLHVSVDKKCCNIFFGIAKLACKLKDTQELFVKSIEHFISKEFEFEWKLISDVGKNKLG